MPLARAAARRAVIRSVLASIAALALPAGLSEAVSPGEVRSRAQALRIARHALAQIRPRKGFAIHEKETIEKDYGWIFFYSPKGRGDSHAYGLNAVGSGPLVVERQDGAWTFLGTTVSPDVAIQLFEKRLRQMHQAPH